MENTYPSGILICTPPHDSREGGEGARILEDSLFGFTYNIILRRLYMLKESYSYNPSDGTERSIEFNYRVDLLQVDLLASGARLVWPRSARPRSWSSFIVGT